MGSFCEIRFGGIHIEDQKSFVPDEFVYLFQERDRGELPGPNGERRVGYFAPRDTILKRLDLAGCSADAARRHFEAWREQELSDHAEDNLEDGNDWYGPTIKALRELSYEEWKLRAKHVLLTRYDPVRKLDVFEDETDRMMRADGPDWLFYSPDRLPIYRSLLEAIPEAQEVSLDIGDLITAGYLEPTDKICDDARATDNQWKSSLQPPVIIAEGTSDIRILRQSLELLHPEVRDYISFFDHQLSKPESNASSLVKLLKAFAAARINTNILAIFDNDAAGNESFNDVSRVSLPANIRVTRLPNIELARSYPTRGAQGEHVMDVNGKAVAIEMFLGRHNLANDDGSPIPVVWAGYLDKVGCYQGSLQSKQTVRAKFDEEVKGFSDCTSARMRFPELMVLWEHIFLSLQWDRSGEPARWAEW